MIYAGRMATSDRSRLDLALVERGLAESRSRAQALVMAGRVTVDGAVVDKAGTPVAGGPAIEVAARPLRVPRRGQAGDGDRALADRSCTGERCLDLGASTGGFTDCLLQHGAAEVIARRRRPRPAARAAAGDPRVHCAGARQRPRADAEMLPYRAQPDHGRRRLHLAAAGAAAGVACAGPAWRAVVLVKPQFEAGRDHVRRGVVRDPEVHAQVLHDVAAFVTGAGRCRPRRVRFFASRGRRATAST